MSEATKLDPGGNVGSLAYRIAEKHLAAFATESQLLVANRATVNPADCEAIVQLGLDAFQWLMRADRAYRIAMFRGQIEHNPELEKALHQDCSTWLEHASSTWRELQSGHAKELPLDNREALIRQIEEMTAILDASQPTGVREELPPQMVPLRDAAVAEHECSF
jgi:hypothetical protein